MTLPWLTKANSNIYCSSPLLLHIRVLILHEMFVFHIILHNVRPYVFTFRTSLSLPHSLPPSLGGKKMKRNAFTAGFRVASLGHSSETVTGTVMDHKIPREKLEISWLF